MSGRTAPVLLVLGHERASATGKHTVRLSAKTVEGLRAYAERWPGTVCALFQPQAQDSDALDLLAVDARNEPFVIAVTDYAGPDFDAALSQAGIVLSGIGYGFDEILEQCRRNSVPYVCITELTLKTEKEIGALSIRNPLSKLRRNLWLHGQEKRNVENLKRAAGIQCNGTPTYETYRPINPNTLLFFDTRVRESQLATAQDLESKRGRSTLHLVFTGRLVRIKGVEDLIEVAEDLEGRHVDFELAICGDGELREALERRCRASNLLARIAFKGNMNFSSELVPFVKEWADVFVCCHKQGDPSCTYLETMACGVPIAGYDNEALAGTVAMSKAGWATPMNRPSELAAKLAELAQAPEEIAAAAQRAREFASDNTFEKTFQRRIDQLVEVWEGVGKKGP